ncbi:type II secretion system protein, partial [Stenotrophomonas maltophilia]
MNKKGFTLVELAIVIVIIGFLAAIAVTSVVELDNTARGAFSLKTSPLQRGFTVFCGA